MSAEEGWRFKRFLTWEEFKNIFGVKKRKVDGKWICMGCGRQITDKRRSTWCSKECQQRIEHKFMMVCSGDYIRRLVWDRDHGICSQCGTPCVKDIHEEGESWEAHHVQAVKDGGGCTTDLDSFITLCYRCHVKTFGRRD